MIIPFNRVNSIGKEQEYVSRVLDHTIKTSDHERFSEQCLEMIMSKFGLEKVWLTNSCTSALEIAALATGIAKGDEVIIPSYTFPSSANPFIRAGASIRFIDSRSDSPLMNEDLIEDLITERTKAIVPVHYGGAACDMPRIMKIAERHGITVIEDAAHAYGASSNKLPLGSIGHIGCISFHSTKNIHCFEGGLLIVNNNLGKEIVEKLLDKGTNRQEFINGKVPNYEWKGYGSAFRLSELHAAYLLGQLEEAEKNIDNRRLLWDNYYNELQFMADKGIAQLPVLNDAAEHNAHIFYLIFHKPDHKNQMKTDLENAGIQTAEHYIPLDSGSYWKGIADKHIVNINSKCFSETLLRLPLYNSMTSKEMEYVIRNIKSAVGKLNPV